MTYNSVVDTQNHIDRVNQLLEYCEVALKERIGKHDLSKLESPEVEIFNEFTPKLKETTYNSDEYKEYLKEMKVALDHHYSVNSHHPEHYENGIRGMDLIDIIEMLCDWKGASERHQNGNIKESIEINQKRFGYSDDLKQIFLNTLPHLED